MTLLTVETLAKHQCISVLANGMIFLECIYRNLIKIITAYFTEDPFAGEFWTSGTDQGCPGKFIWCGNNRTFLQSEINWKPGHPTEVGDCVYLNSVVGPMNASHLVTEDCNVKKRFLCEVKKFLDFKPGLIWLRITGISHRVNWSNEKNSRMHWYLGPIARQVDSSFVLRHLPVLLIW